MATSNADQEIRIKYTLDTSDALKRILDMQSAINTVFGDLVRLSQQTTASLKTVAQSMKDAFKASEMSKAQAKISALNPMDKADYAANKSAILKEADVAIRKYNEALNQAVIQLKKYQTEQGKAAKSTDSATKSIKEAQKSLLTTNSAMKTIGNTAKYVFGAVIGMSVINAIRGFIRAIDEAIQKAINFEQANVKLMTGLREMTRRGITIDTGEVITELDKLEKQFAMLSKTELMTSFSLLTTRFSKLGMTIKDVSTATEIAAFMQIMNPELYTTTADSANMLARYLTTGLGNGVEATGLLAGRAADKLIAFEAGIGATLETLSPMEKGMLRLKFLYEQVGTAAEDMAFYTESSAGKIKAAESEIQDATIEVATQLVPLKVAWANFTADVTIAFMNFFKYFTLSTNMAITFWGSMVTNIIQDYWFLKKVLDTPLMELNFEQISKDFTDLMTKQGQAMRKSLKDMYVDIKEMYTVDLKNDLDGALDGVELGTPLIDVDQAQINATADELANAYKDAFDDNLADIAEAGQDFVRDYGTIEADGLEGQVDTWDDYFSDIDNLSVEAQQELLTDLETGLGEGGEYGDILEDGLQEAADIWQDYFQTIDDINREESQDILDAQIELQQEIQDVGIEYQQKLQDAARKYREAELKAERDYQEKLRRLREEFLFDLEDALRERDALQVLRLMRRYALDKEQLEREKDLEAEERAENYRNELEEIRIWRERRLQELRLEHQRRLEEIRLQAEREREEAAREREQKMAELQADLEQERIDRLAAYNQELIDLDKQLSDRIAIITTKMFEEKQITQAMAEQINAILMAEFGPGGKSEAIYGSLVAQINSAVSASIAAMAAMATAAAAYGGFDTAPYNSSSSGGTASGGANLSPTGLINAPLSTYSNFALGGTMYANAPTSAMFGENGPEIAQFTPLSKLNTNDLSPVSNSSAQALQNGGGKIKLEVWLSDGLESRIIDNTMGQLASIFEGR